MVHRVGAETEKYQNRIGFVVQRLGEDSEQKRKGVVIVFVWQYKDSVKKLCRNGKMLTDFRGKCENIEG